MSASKASSLQQRTIYFDGRVQGVGFRYTTQQIAAGYRVLGFVQNLDDGRVLLVAEGEAVELDGFVDHVRRAMHGYVRDVQISMQAATGEFASFRVKH